jgi:hypothetical protein
MSRICKKCLIGVEAEQYLELIQKNRMAIHPKDRTVESEYARRIEICETCDYLTGPTCRACGCYAELRALRKNTHCPYRKW